jgi:hypothetical protein
MRRTVVQLTLTLLGATAGIAALFLPFTSNYSPLDAALEDAPLWMVAIPFFLSVFVAAGSMRWLFRGALTPVDRAIAWCASVAVAGVTLYFIVALLVMEGAPTDLQGWLLIVMVLTVLAIGAWAVSRSSKNASSSAYSPVMALQVAYLGNAVMCLRMFFGEWQIGAWCALVAALAYMVQIVMVSTTRAPIRSPAKAGHYVP